ncbi:hypothetical protein V6W59_11075 [Mannheimia sp. HC-2023]|uniref:hypothetical protein n=1 Tax=Mannheimia indoligenes TaxID=3103145 RepID=UPI002FE62BAD
MSQNRLSHLNDRLFETLDRLNDESISKDELQNEIARARARAITKVSEQIISCANTALEGEKFRVEYGYEQSLVLPVQFTQHPKLPKLGDKNA